MRNDLLKRALLLYGRCVLATVLGTFMYFSVGLIAMAISPNTNSTGEMIIINIVALLIQGFLCLTIIYAEMWKQGDKDGGPVMFGGAEGDPHLGLKVGLLAAIPSIIGFAILIAEKLIGFWPQYVMVYRAANFALYPLIALTMGTNWNVPASDISWGGILLSLLPTVIIALAAWGFYYIGYRQFTFAQKLMYKKDRSKDNKLR